MKKIIIIAVLAATSLSPFALQAQSEVSTTVKRKRAPVLDMGAYQRVAIGDIVGATGSKTTSSLDVTDALTTALFNANTYEIIDRNALQSILSSQTTELTAINEGSVSALSEKLSSAVMIIGRIQNEKLYRERKSESNAIVVNGCSYSYWWELTGDVTAQIKIIDVKTGNLLYSNPITQKIALKTKTECAPYELGDTEHFMKEALADLGKQIAHLVVPYEEDVTVTFDKPLLAMFKNPFKGLDAAISSFKNGDNQAGLDILKAYAEDTSLKKVTATMAAFNYGAGLYIAEEYDLAEAQLKKAVAMGSYGATLLLPKIEVERKAQQELAKHTL